MDVISAFANNRFGVIIPIELQYLKYEINLPEYEEWSPAILKENFCKINRKGFLPQSFNTLSESTPNFWKCN